MIPKIIHQIWETEIIPDVWQGFVISWHQHNPGWRYNLWSAERREAYIEKYYPEYGPIYDQYQQTIQKADIFKYIILSAVGGVYADLDMECLAPFDRTIAGRKFIVGREPGGAGQEWGRDYVFGSATMAAEPYHPFIDRVLKTVAGIDPESTSTTDVLTTTGPFMMTDLLDDYRHQHGVDDTTILGSEAFYPFGAYTPELYALIGKTDEALGFRQRAMDQGAVAIHYWWGAWLKDFEGGELINPSPNNVSGFVFYPGVDSDGSGIGCGKRYVAHLADHARAMDSVKGFNTNGEFKSSISPPRKWRHLDNSEPNEGLYVKASCIKPIMP